jgi:hypothetical protein
MPRSRQKKPFHCSECLRKFKSRNALNIHCGMTHRAVIHVFTHKRRVRRVNPDSITCKYCDQSFDKVKSRNRHMLHDPKCKERRYKDISELGHKAKSDNECLEVGKLTDLPADLNSYQLQANFTCLEGAEMEYKLIPVQEAEMAEGAGLNINQENSSKQHWIPVPEDYDYILEPGKEDDTPPPALRYNEELQVWVKEYPVKTIGAPIRRATREEMAKWVWGEPGDIGHLVDPDNFQIAEFALETGLSVKERERFLGLKMVSYSHDQHKSPLISSSWRVESHGHRII